MRCRACGSILSLAALLAAGACTKTTITAPSSTTGSATTTGATVDAALTASIGAPRPLTPANNAAIANQAQPVTLVAQNAVITKSSNVTYTFEVATDAAFGTKVQIKGGVAEGSGGQTSVKLDPLAPAKDYYWHVQATGGGTTGVFGAVYKFTIGPAIVLNAPVPIGPLTGAQTTSRPALLVNNATRQGTTGPITYFFEISTTPTFAPDLMTGNNVEGINETGFIPTTDLPSTGTLYWRATAMDATDGVTSAPSAVQSFTANALSQAAKIAAQLGMSLWPGAQPTGTNGQAVLGDSCDGSPNWAIATCYSPTAQINFQTPTIEAVRFFDLFDRGYDPVSAINWMNSNGYPTQAVWYPAPKNVLGLALFYLAARNQMVGPGAIWDIVINLG